MVSVCCPTVTLGAVEGDIVGGGASKWTMVVRFRRAFWAEGGKRGVTAREKFMLSQFLIFFSETFSRQILTRYTPAFLRACKNSKNSSQYKQIVQYWSTPWARGISKI